MSESKHVDDRKNQLTMTVKREGMEKVSVDIISPVTINLPFEEIKKNKEFSPITKKYQVVDKNVVKFAGKVAVKGDSGGIKQNLTIFITEQEDIKPLLGMDWVRDFIGTTRKIESTRKTTDHSENDKKIANFKKLFN